MLRHNSNQNISMKTLPLLDLKNISLLDLKKQDISAKNVWTDIHHKKNLKGIR